MSERKNPDNKPLRIGYTTNDNEVKNWRELMDSNSELQTRLAGKQYCLKLTEFVARQHYNPTTGYPARFMEVVNGIQPLNFVVGPWLAGGSIRRLFDGNNDESDFDLFFASEAQLQSFKDTLNTPWRTTKVISENELNVTLEVTLTPTVDAPQSKPFKLQLIKFYFGSPEEVLEWFDYTNCQFLTDGNTLMVGQYTLYDIGRKQLRVNNVHHALSTVRRMLKYAKQGYSICDGTINDVLVAVANNPSILQEKVKYID
jgi:hypothetical protein